MANVNETPEVVETAEETKPAIILVVVKTLVLYFA